MYANYYDCLFTEKFTRSMLDWSNQHFALNFDEIFKYGEEQSDYSAFFLKQLGN